MAVLVSMVWKGNTLHHWCRPVPSMVILLVVGLRPFSENLTWTKEALTVLWVTVSQIWWQLLTTWRQYFLGLVVPGR